jgi:fucose permease
MKTLRLTTEQAPVKRLCAQHTVTGPTPSFGTRLFVLGLGVALLYPLTLGFAIGAAGDRGDTASARFMLAAGLAIASMPVVLGALADEVGLHMAHLLVPALVALALICFVVAQALERRRIALARCS